MDHYWSCVTSLSMLVLILIIMLSNAVDKNVSPINSDKIMHLEYLQNVAPEIFGSKIQQALANDGVITNGEYSEIFMNIRDGWVASENSVIDTRFESLKNKKAETE